MANWKFTDDYGSTYPSLQYSFLSLLVFSDHTITGTTFTGVIDVAASGVALQIMGPMLGMTSIPVSGTVTAIPASLTVTFQSTNNQQFTSAIAACIPLIGGAITKDAYLKVNTVAALTDPEGDAPLTDVFSLNVVIAIGSASVTISTQIPTSAGLFFLTGEFEGVGITLNDLNFLMGSLGTNNSWFPSTQLGPYSEGQTSFGLLGISLLFYLELKPLRISVNTVTVFVGISKLPLMGEALYLDPLGVWVTVTNPTTNPVPTWGLEGAVKLLNYANQGLPGLSNPDFIFNFTMSFPSPGNNYFGVSANLDNPSQKSVNIMLQDLMGQGTNVGIAEDITVNSFEFETNADVSTGTIDDFSTSIVMSGGFGIFQNTVRIEEMSISVIYSAT